MIENSNNFTRRAFIQGAVVTGLGLTLTLVSCKKSTVIPEREEPTPPDDNTNEESLRITDVTLPFSMDVSKEMEFAITGKGFVMGDEIVFQPVVGGSQGRITADIGSITASSAVIILPGELVSGRYEIYVMRNTKTFLLGATTLNFVFNANIPDKEGMTVKGVVYVNGVGLAGVVVSDGFAVTKTDANGVYYLPSTKKHKYVFVSIPGNYEVATNQSLPLFFSRLTRAEHIVEICDFELTPVNNNDHVVMVLGDMHLANRNNDIAQFQKGFLVDVNQSISNFKNAGTKVYALTLGDMTWETYWQSNSYALPEYLREMNKIQCPVFNTIGNHDNDPANVGDWDTSGRFKTVIGPNYYSFNIGKIHYFVLDNIEYLNTNDRNYNPTIVSDVMNWLRKDLATIEDKTTPIVIAMHIQLFNNPNINGGTESRNRRLTNSQEFIDALDGFSTVHLLTGHTHMNYNVRYSPSLMEHNVGAVCATWWWTGALANNHICKDGTPGGYAIWEINNSALKWTYKSIGHDVDYQFRTYDLNKVHLTKEKYAPAYTGTAWNTYAAEYANPNQNDNEVLINVWNYDTDWTVEVTENGATLPVTRVYARDPLHIISYSAKRLNQNNVPTADFVTAQSAHLFKVKASSSTSTLQIKVSDSFGRVYTENMVRPKENWDTL
jgi:hypothetical protein